MTVRDRTARVADGARRVDEIRTLDPGAHPRRSSQRTARGAISDSAQAGAFENGGTAPGGGPGPHPHRTVEVAPCEKKCALEGCSAPVVGSRRKLYCSERCQRIVAQRRWRAGKPRESATCKRPGCGRVFGRDATSERRQVYCSPECLALDRSAEYRARPDIQAGIGAARRAAAPGSGHARPKGRSTCRRYTPTTRWT